MNKLLYCYHGEIEGKHKVAIPRMYAGKNFSGEYDIYTIEMEKEEEDIRPKYILKHDVDEVYNRRNFNTKKYKFNSLNFKDMYTLERTHRVLIIELENKSAIYVAGKIVNEEPITVEDGRFVEIARKYEYDDSPNYINKKIGNYIDELRAKGEIKDYEDSDIDKSVVWREDTLTVDDFGLENLDINFIGEPIYSEGLSPKFLGYSFDIGLSAYEEGGAENYIYDNLAKKEKCVFGIVIYKDFIRILVDEGAFVINKEGDWKNVISEVVNKFTSEFGTKNMIILQQIEERVYKNNKKGYIFNYVLKKDTIYNK